MEKKIRVNVYQYLDRYSLVLERTGCNAYEGLTDIQLEDIRQLGLDILDTWAKIRAEVNKWGERE